MKVTLRVAAETLAGCLVLAAAVACVPRVLKRSPAPSSVAPTGVCQAKLATPPMLCNEVTLDGARECAVCAECRGGLSTTGLYCVAAGCDDAQCKRRTP